MVVGSHSIQNEYSRLRKMGAAARAMLIQAAAQQWQVDPSVCRAENGQVINTQNNQTLGYGTLVEAAILGLEYYSSKGKSKEGPFAINL
jgi:isoquinoline 1-oxidoreductase beta subunit